MSLNASCECEEIKKICTKTVKELIKLIKDYAREVNLSPQEFIDDLISNGANKISDLVAKLFLLQNKNERILECIAENYSREYKIDSNDMILVKIIIYLIIFEITENIFEEIKEIFKGLKMTMCINLLKFFNREELLILVTEASCRVFDNEYVLNAIINPLITRTSLIERLQHELIENVVEKNKPILKPPTMPASPKLTKAKLQNKRIKTSVEQVENKTTFKTKEIPSTTYHEDNTIKKKIQQARENNRATAIELLEKANCEAFKCSKIENKPTMVNTEPTTKPKQQIKANKVPKFKEVEVKKNAAVLMREAALFAKNQEKEIKKLEALTFGAFDDALIEEWEEEERKRIQQENIQNIEKKHLQGLLTYEEALLAKQNLIQTNRLKMEEFKAEKDILYKNLEEWKKLENEKIKQLVEKAQNIEKAFKESEKRHLEIKYYNARILEQETKKLLNEAMAEQQEELNRKIDLIKELKALHSVKELYRKEFDPTECPNLGLMCEMSIAELQERLGLLKMELKEDLKVKKKAINESRQQRKDLLQSVEEYIEFNRNERKYERREKKCDIKLEETAEIVALKDKLSELRQNRMKCICKKSSSSCNICN